MDEEYYRNLFRGLGVDNETIDKILEIDRSFYLPGFAYAVYLWVSKSKTQEMFERTISE